MDIGSATAETRSGANFLSAPGPRTLEGEKDAGDAALQKALEIARTELARRRRRLGNLTQEQETVIEELLFRTVSKVSELAGRILESRPAVPYRTVSKVSDLAGRTLESRPAVPYRTVSKVTDLAGRILESRPAVP